jgi:hypothetical protein
LDDSPGSGVSTFFDSKGYDLSRKALSVLCFALYQGTTLVVPLLAKIIWALAPEVRLSTVHFRPIGLEKRTPAAKAALAHLIFMARVNPCPSLRTFSAACLAPVNLLLGLKKAQGLKPTSFLGLCGPTKVVP